MQGASLLSVLMFGWIAPLLRLGNAQPLDHADLMPLESCDTAAEVLRRVEASLPPDRLHGSRTCARSLAVGFARAFGRPFFAAALLKLVHDSLLFVGPQVLRGIIHFLKEPGAPMSRGLLYAFVLLLSGVVQSLCLRQYFYRCFRTGMRLRSAVVVLVYRKALTISPAARQRLSTGKITNLMSVDAQRMQDLTPYLQSIWFSFYQIGMCLTFLWREVGAACLAGVLVLCAMIPVTARISYVVRGLQRELMTAKDRRITLTNEALAGIKTIKMQAWEAPMFRKVGKSRAEEMRLFWRYRLVSALLFMAQNCAPLLVTIATFAAYTAQHDLDVSTAFVCLALFDILRSPLWQLPRVINTIIEARVSLGRLAEFLSAPDICLVGGLPAPAAPAVAAARRRAGVCVRVRDADFTWLPGDDGAGAGGDGSGGGSDGPPSGGATTASAASALHRVELEVRTGELVAIVGHVGSGKSSLLAALLGEMRRTAGQCGARAPALAYAAQSPFIRNASLRDNVLFGNEFDGERYSRVLRACALLPDLEQLPAGDATEIGEKGINLSGGQKARVALARAAYAKADLYLIDDPLSAVDAHVAAHIFGALFGGGGGGDDGGAAGRGVGAGNSGGDCNDNDGASDNPTSEERSGQQQQQQQQQQQRPLLAGKTVLLVTNALQFLPSPAVSRIIVMRPPLTGGITTSAGIAITDDEEEEEDDNEEEEKKGRVEGDVYDDDVGNEHEGTMSAI
eukprot:g3616.t1